MQHGDRGQLDLRQAVQQRLKLLGNLTHVALPVRAIRAGQFEESVEVNAGRKAFALAAHNNDAHTVCAPRLRDRSWQRSQHRPVEGVTFIGAIENDLKNVLALAG